MIPAQNASAKMAMPINMVATCKVSQKLLKSLLLGITRPGIAEESSMNTTANGDTKVPKMRMLNFNWKAR